MKILPPGFKTGKESTQCSQVSGVAGKHHPNPWPSETLPCVLFLGRQGWARDLVHVLALTDITSPHLSRMWRMMRSVLLIR